MAPPLGQSLPSIKRTQSAARLALSPSARAALPSSDAFLLPASCNMDRLHSPSAWHSSSAGKGCARQPGSSSKSAVDTKNIASRQKRIPWAQVALRNSVASGKVRATRGALDHKANCFHGRHDARLHPPHLGREVKRRNPLKDEVDTLQVLVGTHSSNFSKQNVLKWLGLTALHL